MLIFLLHLAELWTASTAEARSSTRDKPYMIYSLDRTCLPYKKEIKLRNSAAIFILDESIPSTREYLSKRDLDCHIELETLNQRLYGFHIFIDEMVLDEESPPATSRKDHCPHDYFQFGRDVGYVTTSMSQRFCGTAPKVHFENTTSAARGRLMTKAGTRWYVEERDWEMDLWVKVKRSTKGPRVHNPRKIRIVVTVFKKNCQNGDMWYRKCPNTKHCIRSDYFCDTIANCVWPNGEDATDERDCREWNSPLGGAGERSSAGHSINVPLIIIVIIFIIIGVLGFGWALRRFVSIYKRQTASSVRAASASLNTSSAPHRDRATGEVDAALISSRAPHDSDNASPSAPGADQTELSDYNYHPPTYDEAVKIEQQGPAREAVTIPTDDPPPYQP